MVFQRKRYGGSKKCADIQSEPRGRVDQLPDARDLGAVPCVETFDQHHNRRYDSALQMKQVLFFPVVELQKAVFVDLVSLQPEKKFIETRGQAALIDNDSFSRGYQHLIGNGSTRSID